MKAFNLTKLFLLLIFIKSCTTKNYDISHVFGEEFNYFFRNFDIVFGELHNSGLDSEIQVIATRETAHYQLNNSDSSEPTIKNDVNSAIMDTKNNLFWSNTEHETDSKNLSKAIVINLDKLESLKMVLKSIRSTLEQLKDVHELKKKPYFVISWQNPLTEQEEEKIRSEIELAEGLEMDTDVYFSFLRCSNDTFVDFETHLETLDSNSDSTDSVSKNQTNTSTTITPRFVTKVSVPSSLCKAKLAEIRLLEFYSIKGSKFIEHVDLQSGMNLAQKVLRRTGHSAPLDIVAAYGYPFRANFSQNNNSFTSGYEADQIQFLGKSLNLTIVVGVGKGWISINNQTLTGMGQQVMDGETDISISASEVLTYRARFLQFLHPTYYTRLWGFFVQPSSSSFRDIFIHAFTGNLWLTMLSTWVLIVLAMLALAVVKRRLNTMHENDSILIQELIVWACGAVCQQGWHVCPESTCMKIIFIFALITGLVSYVAYSAALVSILSVKVVPIKNLNDIISRGYTIYQDNQTINALYVIQKLEQDGLIPCLSREQRSIRSEIALPKVLSETEHSAFIGAADFFYPVAKQAMNDTAICNTISRISISGRPVRGGMFIKKGSPFKDFFNHRLLIMYERGIRFRLLETYFRQSAVMCLEKTGSTKDPLGFNDVYTAFLILLFGHCLSFVILLIEKMFPPVHYATTTDAAVVLCSTTFGSIVNIAYSGLGLSRQKNPLRNYDKF